MSDKAAPPTELPKTLATDEAAVASEPRPPLALVPAAESAEPTPRTDAALAASAERKAPPGLMHPGTADALRDACDAEFQQAERENELLDAKSSRWIGFVLAFFVGMLTVGFTSFEKLQGDSNQRLAASLLLFAALVFEAAAFLQLLRAQFVARHKGRPEGMDLIERGETAPPDTIARSVARHLAGAAVANVALNRSKARLIRFASWVAFAGFACFFAALLLLLEHRLFPE